MTDRDHEVITRLIKEEAEAWWRETGKDYTAGLIEYYQSLYPDFIPTTGE